MFGAWWAASCAAPLGPGYLVEKQEIRVQFAAGAQAIHIDADYQLRNTGNRAIHELELILPAGRRVHVGSISTTWDGAAAATASLPAYPRNSVIRFAKAWSIGAAHSLHISYDILPPAVDSAGLNFASDAFYLPASGWSPEFPQARGLFGFGGVPPKKWDLVITVPDGFLLHSSGTAKKTQRDSASGGKTFRVQQTVDDRYPFVIAGRYAATEIRDPHQKVILWSRAASAADGAAQTNATPQSATQPAILQQASSQLVRTIDVYNSIFGAPPNRVSTFWIVQCPVPDGCLSNFSSNLSSLLDDGTSVEPTAELVSSDTVMVDTSKGAPQLAAAAAPSLAASWLGYGRNPGFFEQTEPLSLLPIFAAARSREEIDGPQVRAQTIRRVLKGIPENPAQPAAAPAPPGIASPGVAGKIGEPQPGGLLQGLQLPAATRESPEVLRAKSLLLFYALQDRYGPKVFHDAITHMLYARASRGFDIDDLIAAFEQETHQNVAEFVRHWMKRPGVPAEFRARYENSVTAAQPAGLRKFSAPPDDLQSLSSKGELP